MITENLNKVLASLPENVTLCAVSKTKPENEILEAYEAGQRIFGENKIQELVIKNENLPKDIQWHYIGHLQRNKVKFIAPFVSLIHGCDSIRLLEKIEAEGKKNDRKIPVLLQIHIANETTKFGFNQTELDELLDSETINNLQFIEISGLMGMATNTADKKLVKEEFSKLNSIFKDLKKKYFSGKPEFKELSMGMSGDYKIATDQGSTIVRVGSSIFGKRDYAKTKIN